MTIPARTIGAAEVRTIAIGELKLIVAIEPSTLTIALVPAEVTAEELMAIPAEVIALGGLLNQVRADLGRDPISAGFIDVPRLVREALPLVPAEDRVCTGGSWRCSTRCRRIRFGSAAARRRDDLSRDRRAHRRRARGDRPRDRHHPALADHANPAATMELGLGLGIGRLIRASADTLESIVRTPGCAPGSFDAAGFAKVRAWTASSARSAAPRSRCTATRTTATRSTTRWSRSRRPIRPACCARSSARSA